MSDDEKSESASDQSEAGGQTIPTPTAHVIFRKRITPKTVDALQGQVVDLHANHDYDSIYLYFSSPGGHVRAGIHLYQVLSGISTSLIMHNTSSIDSIANVIFLAGDHRFAAPGTSFLFHGVTARFKGETNMNYAQLKEQMSSIEQDEEKIVELISGNSALARNELKNLHRQGEAKGTDWATTKGLIHSVRPVNIPDDADVAAIG